jgi:hypothetical protein
MLPATGLLPLPAVPVDVLDFAKEHNVVDHLQPLLSITRQVFPAAPISLRIDDDPEIADYRTIRYEVDVTGWGVEELVAAHNRWRDQLFQVCPSPDIWLFRLLLVQTK